MSALGIALFSAAVGSAVTLLWEAVLAPRQASRSLAEILSVDLSLHMQSMTADLARRRDNPKTVPRPHPIPLGLYQGVSGRIGELPRDLVGHTLNLYRIFDRINEIAGRADALHSRLRELPDESGIYESLREQLASEVALYSSFVENAVERLNQIQPVMIAAARPRWSPRFWFASAPRRLDIEEMAAKVEKQRADHEARMQELEAEDPTD